MPTVTPPSLTPTPTPAPQRNDRNTFSARFDPFITWFISACTEFPALATNVYNNALDAFSSATAASNSATNAAASAASAVATAGVAKWLAATAYTQGQTAWSPINFLTYRRTIAGTTATDPSADATNWALVTPRSGGVGGQTVAGNTTLTTSSPANINVTPATLVGSYVTLPDATTCLTGATLFAVTNNSAFDYGIRNSAGTKLGWVRSGQTATIGLSDNSTAAGSWTLGGIEKLSVTAHKQVAQDYTQIVQLDTDRFVFYGITAAGSTLYAITYNATTGLWGSEVAIATNVLSSTFVLVKSATDQLCAIYTSSITNKDTVTVLTCTGLDISPGSPVVSTYVNNAGAINAVNGGGFGLAAIMVGTTCAYVYRDTTLNQKVVQAFTISGTVPTLGTPRLIPVSPTQNPTALFVSGAVLRVLATEGNNFLYMTPFTVSGNSLTAGTAVSQGANGACSNFNTFQNANGNVIVVPGTGGATQAVALFKLTGTVEASVALTDLSFNQSYVVTGTTVACYDSTTGRTSLVTDTAGTLTNSTPATLSNLINTTPVDVTGNIVKYVSSSAVSLAGKVNITTVNYGVSPPAVVNSDTVPTASTTASLIGFSTSLKNGAVLNTTLSISGVQYSVTNNYSNPVALSIGGASPRAANYPAIVTAPTMRGNSLAEAWTPSATNNKFVQRIEAAA